MKVDGAEARRGLVPDSSGNAARVHVIVAMVASVVVYAGLVLVLAGLISLLKPLRVLCIRSRAHASVILLAGVLLAGAALAWPFSTSTAAATGSRLDEFMPEWQFNEIHRIHVAAPPERVFVAIHAVRADEIALFQLLTAIRRGGRSGPESILNAPEQKPLLDVAIATTFLLLADDPPRELVVGTLIAAPEEAGRNYRVAVEDFRRVPGPGVTLATMNFLVAPDGAGGCDVSTETRVRSGDLPAARRFAIYWRLIHPGSDIIRRMWLRAVKHRAERG